ncbi:MAG: RNA polymerase sigma factor [Phycisphaerales bacterium JB040]
MVATYKHNTAPGGVGGDEHTRRADLQSLAPLSDGEVVARIIEGDTAAFELLMRRHNQRLFRLARSIVSDDATAEDIVQETYLRAFASLARFEGRSSVITWLSRIALHEALRQRRRQQRAPGALPCGHESVDESSRERPSEIEVRRSQTEIVAALDELSPVHRAVVMLRLVEGLSTRETAQSLRLSESNVKVSLHRAKRELSGKLNRKRTEQLRQHFAFAEDRCDRIVTGVFARIRKLG